MPVKRKIRNKIPGYLPFIVAIAGAVAGFAYYYFTGCATGTCPIKQNPVLMTAYGGVIGFLAGYVIKPEEKEKK